MICQSCGNNLREEDKFCTNCGKEISRLPFGENLYINSEKNWKTVMRASTVLQMLLLILGLGYAWLIILTYLKDYSSELGYAFEYFDIQNELNFNIPYQVTNINYIWTLLSVFITISFVLQIISYIKLKKIYKYNYQHNIIKENPIWVKKSSYVALAILLGFTGLHKFYEKKKIEGFIYLIIFIASLIWPPSLILLIITISLSYADGTIAMCKKVNSKKMIDL